MKKILLAVVLICSLFVFSRNSLAGVCEFNPNCDIDQCKNLADECQRQINMVSSAIKPNEDKMKALEADINALEANIAAISKQLDTKKAAIAVNEQKFAKQQTYLNSQIRNYYKNNWTSSLGYFLTIALSGTNTSDILNNLAYHQSLINQNKATITSLVLQLSDLNTQKKQLEDNQNWLADKQANLAVTLAPIKKLVIDAKAYQSQLTQTLGALNSRQQQLIAQRLGSLNLSRSAGISMACADDRNIDPGFSPRFAFYTFGIPHRVGMNQFGAYGRAQAGQSYDQILHAYYNFEGYKDWDTGTKINVEGYGGFSLEDYVKRIYEVPNSWGDSGGMEALKSQAIAARSYALAYTNNGSGSICTTQSCQVFQPNEKGGNWAAAVDATRGKVMVQGSNPIKAWFSSTDGGYTLSSGDYGWSNTSWTKHTRDTTGDVNSISDLQAKAYDHSSPCFYNAQGWRTEYNKSAWLKREEVADIANVIMLSAYTNDWDGWDASKVKSELQNHGKQPFNQVTDVSMNFDFGSGRTTTVTVSGDAPTQTFDGTTFKNYFNVRAPANIAIVGPLFNIEKK